MAETMRDHATNPNITADSAGTNLTTPAIDPANSVQGTATYTLPNPVSGEVGSILRPGDMQVTFAGTPAASHSATGVIAQLTDTNAKSAASSSPENSLTLPRIPSVPCNLGRVMDSLP